LKEFGKESEEAAIKEMQQHHDMETFQPRYSHELTGEERREALSSLMHLKKKRNGKIKGRSCAGDRPQRKVFTKDEVASPTVTTESVLITTTIDVFEDRDVATVDLPGAFLHTEVDPNDDIVRMVLRGELAELMVKMNPSMYRKYVTPDKKGRTLLYVELQKAVYGTLKTSLLFYQKLVKQITRDGFKLNPYDPCVANKMIGGKQMTICWHVDDLKISHLNPKVVDKMVN
jgi:hypothetical protein